MTATDHGTLCSNQTHGVRKTQKVGVLELRRQLQMSSDATPGCSAVIKIYDGSIAYYSSSGETI